MSNFDDLKSELSKPSNEPENMSLGIIENSRQFSRARIPQMLYLSQVAYSLNLISSQTLSFFIQPDQNLEYTNTASKIAQFTNTCVFWSNIYMIQTLKMLEANINNKGDDEPRTLKQTIRRFN